ncbi:MAG: ShlB/FhaC/HecB family hemolysin secretion/activation protein [Betaproteobacteria bacterium]|nr:ShlB/FhaC/HecB family hemolysin secretion/activation protein [Betaproteobacteria bacterium]MCL2885745.1 ShlB/FhaC/HecB family hemolysin secretion/activation protein [Betaproteobacteria bacterium]
MPFSSFRRLHPRLVLFLALFPFCTPLLSQTLPLPGDRDLIRERQQRLLEEQRRRLEELQRLPSEPERPTAAQPAEQGGCINIQRIRIEGADQLSEASQRELVAPFEGQCLDSGTLNELLAAITKAYLDRGLITSRAYLPAQDLSAGILTIRVIEGRLEGFENEGMPSEREIRMSFPGRTGNLLDLRELEQMLDQLGRLPSRASTLDLVPGTEPGMSKVQVKAMEPQKSWRAGLRFDNSGSKSTGERQLGTNLAWDSPLGLADQLTLTAGRDVVSDHWKNSNNQGLHYSLPLGWWTFNYSYGRSSYRSQEEIFGFAYENRGDSQQHRLRAERLLHRDSASKTGMSLGLNHLRANNYFEDIKLDVSSYRLSEFELSFNHGRRIESAFLNIEAGWQRGIGALDAQGSGHPQGSEPNARYNKYTLTLSALSPFTIGKEQFSFESLATGQKSENALHSPQRVGLGGLNSVRGFKDQILYGNSGGYWRNQLRWRKEAGLTPYLDSISIALAYDIGAIRRNDAQGDESGRLSGRAIELAAQGKYASLSLTYAQALERPRGWKREHPVYFSVTLAY